MRVQQAQSQAQAKQEQVPSLDLSGHAQQQTHQAQQASTPMLTSVIATRPSAPAAVAEVSGLLHLKKIQLKDPRSHSLNNCRSSFCSNVCYLHLQ